MGEKTPHEQVSDAATFVALAVQDMAEAGISPSMICIALARHLREQAKLAIPDEGWRKMFIESLVLPQVPPERGETP